MLFRSELKTKNIKDIKQKDLTKLIQASNVPTEWFKRNLLLLLMSTVVESNSNSLVNHKILNFLKDTEKIKDYDWCDYVMNVLIKSAEHWKRKNEGHFRGPIILLLVSKNRNIYEFYFS